MRRIQVVQQFVHFLNRILRAFLRPVLTRCADEKQTLSWIRLTVRLRLWSSVRLQIRFKDRFQYRFCGGLRHSVPYRRNTLDH
jgi:hypothetical protein